LSSVAIDKASSLLLVLLNVLTWELNIGDTEFMALLNRTSAYNNRTLFNEHFLLIYSARYLLNIRDARADIIVVLLYFGSQNYNYEYPNLSISFSTTPTLSLGKDPLAPSGIR
jgi:hypothetical protein